MSERFIYPRWNQNLLWISLSLFVLAGAFSFVNKQKMLGFTLVGALILSFFSMQPYHEVDQLFYKQLQVIQIQNLEVSMADKIELCEHVKTDYTNLKTGMILQLEKVCAEAILELSKNSSQELNKAFNWAYSEYAKKPQAVQAEALACLYAETDQKQFAVELSEKHQFQELTGRLKSTGRCRSFGQRQIASIESK